MPRIEPDAERLVSGDGWDGTVGGSGYGAFGAWGLEDQSKAWIPFWLKLFHYLHHRLIIGMIYDVTRQWAVLVWKASSRNWFPDIIVWVLSILGCCMSVPICVSSGSFNSPKDIRSDNLGIALTIYVRVYPLIDCQPLRGVFLPVAYCNSGPVWLFPKGILMLSFW